MKIAVLGDGGWGTALARLVFLNGHTAAVYCRRPEMAETIMKTGENPHLPGVHLPAEILFSSDAGKVLDNAETVFLVTPSQYMRSMLKQWKNYIPGNMLLVNASKGIENGTLLRMEDVIKECLGPVRYAVLSGPSHAEEVARDVPTAVTAASRNPEDAKLVQKTVMNRSFRVYTSGDVTGVETAGALKNVMAIAAGIVDGMGLGDNTKAALITRGIAEMSRLGIACGGQRETFAGLSGVGDMIVTCTSRHSRNRHVGEELGKGHSLAEILSGMNGSIAEGVKTAVSARELAVKTGVETPVIAAVCRILNGEISPGKALAELMTRSAKEEQV